MSQETYKKVFERTVIEWFKEQRDQYPGERAELRRLREPLDAVYCSGFWRLFNQLKKIEPLDEPGLKKRDLHPKGWICYLAVMLSHQKENEESISLPRAMGQLESGVPRVSRLRFRRMIECETRDELFVTLLRTLTIFKGHFQFSSLFDLLRWNNDSVKRHWAIEYYQAATNKEPT